MNKNIAILVLAILCVGLFFYGLTRSIEAKKNGELAKAQIEMATECSQITQQKDKELEIKNHQLQLALQEADKERARAQENVKIAQGLYEKTLKSTEQKKK
jgi:cytochrome c-type biogenesis protein CcmH/NrfG